MDAHAWRHETGLARALNRRRDRPELRPDVEVAEFATHRRTRTAIVHRPQVGRYVRLSADEAEILRAFDGTRSVEQIEGTFGDVAEVVDLAARERLLTRDGVDAYALIRSRRAPISVAERAVRSIRAAKLSVPAADMWATALYRTVGRHLFRRSTTALLLAIAVPGAVAFGALLASSHDAVRPDSAPAAGFLMIGLLASLVLHEIAHAMAVKHSGRRIRDAGLRLYFGQPCFYVDSSDLLLAPRRDRVVNAVAGMYAEAVLAGAASLTAAADDHATLLFQYAAVTYLNIVVNLVPFIELDGYWLLTDLLDLPQLRARALDTLRAELPARLARRRPALTREESGLAAFGVASLVTGCAALLAAAYFWEPGVGHVLHTLWSAGVAGQACCLGLLAVLVAAIIDSARRKLAPLFRRARGYAADLRFRAQTGWRVEAAQSIARATVPGTLDEDVLGDLAGRVSRQLVRSGEALVRAGDPPTAMYVIRRGHAVTTRKTATTAGLSRLGPGAVVGFDDVAGHRRHHSTAVADGKAELFVVDVDTFDRCLAPNLPSRATEWVR